MKKIKNKLIIMVLILLLIQSVIPIGQSAFNIYDTKTFGGKVDVQGAGNVTTNASTNISFTSARLNGYLNDTGGLTTTVWFEYGLTPAYGNTAYLDDVNITFNRSYIINNGWIYYDNVLGIYSRNVSGQKSILFGILVNHYINRGFVEWNISDIPDGVNITKVDFNYHTYTHESGIWAWVKQCINARPSSDTPQDIYDAIGIGKKYYGDSNNFPIYSSNQTAVLNTQARTDLKSQLLNDWFAVGFQGKQESYGTDTNSLYSKAAPHAYPYPTLYVEYNGSALSLPSEFSYKITGLLPDTTYHFRAVAQNGFGRTNGSDMTFHTRSALYDSPNSTLVEETTVTLSSELLSDIGQETTCGFWIGNVSVNSTNFEQNVTCLSGYFSGETFARAITGLTSGEYYYVRSWINNSYGFWNSTNESYFLTKPQTITNFISNKTSSTSITLKWTNATIGAGTNHSVYIRYNDVSPGGGIDRTWGSLGYNGTGNWTEITGLSQDTEYYFVAWTLINASGSPLYWKFSDGYVSTYNSTTGGNYTVYVRFENESNGINHLVNLSKYGPHRIIIHYDDETDNIIFDEGKHTTDIQGNYSQNASGKFNFTTNKTVEFIEFHWNDTKNVSYRCNRIVVVTPTQRIITFYIRTNLPVYGEKTALMNESIVRYNYNFIDETGLFTPENGAYAIVYCYNSTGEKQIIHSEYFDVSRQVHPWLIYDKKYYVGVKCTELTYERIGIAPAGDNTDPEIIIPYTSNITYLFFELIDLSLGWDGTGFYVYYTDTTASSKWTNFSVYGYYNETLIHYENISLTNTYNFTFTCNTSNSYYWKLITKLDSANDNYDGVYETGLIPMISGMDSITDITSIDDIFEIIFGLTPVFNVDNPALYAPWTYIIIFIVCFMWLASTAKMNAVIGSLGVGLILLAAGSLITGVQILYDWAPTDSVNTPAILVIGIFIVVMSIIAAHGGVENR